MYCKLQEVPSSRQFSFEIVNTTWNLKTRDQNNTRTGLLSVLAFLKNDNEKRSAFIAERRPLKGNEYQWEVATSFVQSFFDLHHSPKKGNRFFVRQVIKFVTKTKQITECPNNLGNVFLFSIVIKIRKQNFILKKSQLGCSWN